MKNQTKQTWMSNFLSNVLGVIVGIALTFGGSYLVQRHGEKKEIRTMMALVKQEIADNKTALERMSKDFQRTKELCGLLLSSEWKTLPQDSVWSLLNKQGVNDYAFMRTSWDIFQNSNVIKNFDDVELILAISELYGYIEKVHKWWQIYIEENIAATQTIKQDTTDLSAHINALLKNKELRPFMEEIYKQAKYNFDKENAVVVDLADYTLHQIDKSGDYHTDVKDLSKDFEKFRENKEKK